VIVVTAAPTAPSYVDVRSSGLSFPQRQRDTRKSSRKKAVVQPAIFSGGVTANIFGADTAAAVAVKTRHWFDRAQFQRFAKNIASRQRAARSLLPIVSQH
jgi:hypothetical protein